MAEQKKGKEPGPEAESSAKPAKGEKKQAKNDRLSKREAREAEAEKGLIAELDRLRALARQIASRYMELLESEIVQIRETIEASRGSGGRLPHLSMMLQGLEGLKVKPEKGRRKDLKRIDRLVALLNRLAQKL